MSEINSNKKVTNIDKSFKPITKRYGRLGKQVESRRSFSSEEKKSILYRTKGHCACCNKKLTIDTMTVEHIVPISRGGTNELKNLLSLCFECNQIKANHFYLSSDFYGAIYDHKLLQEIWDVTAEWFTSVKDNFNFEKYPFISPSLVVNLGIGKLRNKSYNPSFCLDVHMVSRCLFDEVQAVTGLVLKEDVTYYVVKRRTTDKLLAVIGISIYKLLSGAPTFEVIWSEMPQQYEISLLFSLVSGLVWRYHKLGIPINRCMVRGSTNKITQNMDQYVLDAGCKYKSSIITYQIFELDDTVDYILYDFIGSFIQSISLNSN